MTVLTRHGAKVNPSKLQEPIRDTLLSLVNQKGCVASAAIVTIKVSSHKNTNTTLRAVLAETCDLAIVIHLVILQHSQLHVFPFVFYLLWLAVHFFLALLTTTASQSQHQVKCGFLLNVVVR